MNYFLMADHIAHPGVCAETPYLKIESSVTQT